MAIEFEKEAKEITANLKLADGYLDCEKIIIRNIKKLLLNTHPVSEIEGYLKKLLHYFEELIVKHKDTADCTNYRYTVGFLDTVLRFPYWYSWIASTSL